MDRSYNCRLQPVDHMSQQRWRSPKPGVSSPGSQKDVEEDMECDSPEFVNRRHLNVQCSNLAAFSVCNGRRYPLKECNSVSNDRSEIMLCEASEVHLWSTISSSSSSLRSQSNDVCSNTTLQTSSFSRNSGLRHSLSTSTLNASENRLYDHSANVSNVSPSRLAFDVDGLKISEGTRTFNLDTSRRASDSFGLRKSHGDTISHSTVWKQNSSSTSAVFGSARLPPFHATSAKRRSHSSTLTSSNGYSGNTFSGRKDSEVACISKTLEKSRTELSQTVLAEQPDFDSSDEEMSVCGTPAVDIAAHGTSGAHMHGKQSNTSIISVMRTLAFIFAAVVLLIAGCIHMPSEHLCVENIDIEHLQKELSDKVHGQHIAINIVSNALEEFFSMKHELLVMSFHGWTGVGKNYISGIIADFMPDNTVHKLLVPLHFPHGTLEEADILGSWIMSNLTDSSCGVHLFIVDEIDKAEESLLHSLYNTVRQLSVRQSPSNVRAIILLLSNSGSSQINAYTAHALTNGRSRSDIKYEDVRPDESVVWRSQIGDDHLVNFTVPFLPLERSHVIQCIMSLVKARGLERNETLVTNILDNLLYFPPDTMLFSKSGCRKISYLIDFMSSTV